MDKWTTQTSAVLFQTDMFENNSQVMISKTLNITTKLKLFNLMKILVSKHASNVPFIVVKYVVVYGIIYWAKVVDYLRRSLPEQDVSARDPKSAHASAFLAYGPLSEKRHHHT